MYCDSTHTSIRGNRVECSDCKNRELESVIEDHWATENHCVYQDHILNPEAYKLTGSMIGCLIEDNGMTESQAAQAIARNAIEDRKAWDWWDSRLAATSNR